VTTGRSRSRSPIRTLASFGTNDRGL